jgi:hypothetical protein
MPQLTHVQFQVNDGGDGTRLFDFDTTSQGSDYVVTISYPGSGPSIINLSKNAPSVPIPPSAARVKPIGQMTLSWDNDPAVLILFTGTLNTANSVSMTNACVAALD